MVAIRFDITSRKLAEQEVRKANSLREIVLESAMYSVIATDVQGTIIFFNREAERILEYKSSEVINKKSLIEFHDQNEINLKSNDLSKEFGQDVKANFNVFVVMSLKNNLNHGEWTYVSKSGRRTTIQLSMTALKDDKNESIGFLAIALDLTEKKVLQSLLEQERANLINSSKMATLGEMAAGIAHEINNPLAIITGKAEQIHEMLKQNNLDVNLLKLNIKKIEETALKISKIIKGLKTFSRSSEADPKSMQNLAELLNETLELIREKFLKKNINIEVIGNTDFVFFCRAAQISQVILNILANAYDAIERQSDPWIKILVEKFDSSFLIKIIDSGPGIPAEIVDKILHPFFTTKPVGKGTGLGLSISKGIIDDHNGQLWVDPHTENTTFIIHLPLESESILMPLSANEAIQSHLALRQRLINYCIVSDGSLKEEEIKVDTNCGLGKWIFQNKINYNKYKEFLELDLLHKEFHKLAGQIVAKVNSGERLMTSVIFGAHSEYDIISRNVVQAIQKLDFILKKEVK